MNVSTAEYVTLIRLREISFKDKDSKPVVYHEFAILDEDGEIITGTCKKSIDIEPLVSGEQRRGFATLEVYPKTAKNVGLRLITFVEN